MDFSTRIEAIRHNRDATSAAMDQERLVVCFGHRAMLCFYLASHLGPRQVVGAFTTADEALACLAARQPSFLLASDHLEAGCGIALVITAKRRWPGLRTLLLITGEPRASQLRAAVDGGCDGLLLETSMGMGTAASALQTVCRGGVVVDSGIIALLRSTKRPGELGEALSPRELEVLGLLARGDNNAQIASALVISIDTVKCHVKNLLLKLGARGRTHAAVLALEQGLVEWPRRSEAR
jgi:DNA-binding NarL/FixJ family response regulator